MSTENLTDKQIADAAAAEKADLNAGADTPVGDGTETTPTPGNPLDQRKALFAKSKNLRARRTAAEEAAHPDAAQLRDALAAEAGQGSSRNELDRGSHFDTNAPTSRERLEAEARGAAPAREAGNPASYQSAGDERVKVKVLGQEFEVPRQDVEDAGGLVAYQKSRAASMQLQQAARERAELKAERDRIEAAKREIEQQRASAGRKAPASNAPGGTPGAAPTQQGGAGDGADVEEQAQAIAADLYSGDPKRARAAIAKVLQASRAPVNTLDPEAVARQAAELLKAQDAATPHATPKTPPTSDPALDEEIKELNAYMADRFADLLNDPALKQQALEEFQRLRAMPENRHRRLVDLGRDAANKVLATGPNPRAQVAERKRSLPPALTGTQAHRPVESAPLDNSSWIERMRQARGLPK